MNHQIFYEDRCDALSGIGTALAPMQPQKETEHPVYVLDATPCPQNHQQLEDLLARHFLFVAALRKQAYPALVLLLIDEEGFVGNGEPLAAAQAVGSDAFVRSMAMECGRKDIFFHAVITKPNPDIPALSGLIDWLSGAAATQNGGRFWLNPQASLGRMIP